MATNKIASEVCVSRQFLMAYTWITLKRNLLCELTFCFFNYWRLVEDLMYPVRNLATISPLTRSIQSGSRSKEQEFSLALRHTPTPLLVTLLSFHGMPCTFLLLFVGLAVNLIPYRKRKSRKMRILI